MEKFCYLGDMISHDGGASQALSARIASVWWKFRELSDVLFGKQGWSLKQHGKNYQFCVRLVFMYCCEMHHMIRMICGMRLVNRVFTDLQDRVGVAVKIEDMIILSCIWWYCYVICQDIDSQIFEVMELEITGKRKNSQPRNLWEGCIMKDLEWYGLRREDA